jgi:hypothetical protein
MSWIQSRTPEPTLSQRLAQFTRDTLPLVLVITLSVLLFGAVELRFGVTPPDFALIAGM